MREAGQVPPVGIYAEEATKNATKYHFDGSANKKTLNLEPVIIIDFDKSQQD